MLFRQTAAGGAADLDGLELGAVLQPAADVENDLPQGRAHGHLDQSDVLDGARTGDGVFAARTVADGTDLAVRADARARILQNFLVVHDDPPFKNIVFVVLIVSQGLPYCNRRFCCAY